MSEEKETKGDEKKVPEKKKMSLTKKIIIGVVAFFVIVFGLAYFATAGAVKVADEFVGHIQSVNPAGAYELFSDEAKKVVPEKEFAVLIEQIGPILNGEISNEGRGISAGTDEDTTSTITYKIPGSDGDTYIMVIELVKEDGEWKVQNFDNQTQENYERNKNTQ